MFFERIRINTRRLVLSCLIQAPGSVLNWMPGTPASTLLPLCIKPTSENRDQPRSLAAGVINIFSRIDTTAHPWRNKLARIRGTSCRIFAQAALPFTNRHQFSPSIGPALTDARKVEGISSSIACSRWFDSWISPVSRARDGDSPAAWCSVTVDCRRRCIAEFSVRCA